MKNAGFKESFFVLSKIIREGAYINIALGEIKDENNRPFVTRLVYGVVEKYFEINEIVKSLSSRPPKPSVKIVILMGVYALLYLDVPAYATVSECVNLTEELGRGEQKGFVNAVLNRVCRKEYDKPDYSNPEVKYNLPEWLINIVKREYPRDYDAILSVTGTTEEHVRLNFRMSEKEFTSLVPNARKTATGYFVRNTETVKRLFAKGMLTYQSLTSTLAVKAMGELNDKLVLDVCSAPGGKAVYAAELGARVTAADIYPHRLSLIKSYAERMGVQLRIRRNDGTALKEEWKDKFDVVNVDAPCSGLGVITKRRDIIFRRSQDGVNELTGIQKRLLSVSSEYVKKDGILIYSTCTILKEENDDVVHAFLKTHPNFRLDKLPFCDGGTKQFLPDDDGTDGFFIARFRRTE